MHTRMMAPNARQEGPGAPFVGPLTRGYVRFEGEGGIWGALGSKKPQGGGSEGRAND